MPPTPMFIFVELPSFHITDMNGAVVALNYGQIGRIISLLQYVRSALRTSPSYAPDLVVSLLFNNETDLWSASQTNLHAEETLLHNYFQSFDSPGAYPIVDAMLLHTKPCTSCTGYFSLHGQHIQSHDPRGGSFRAKFTPRSDQSYTPVFYLSQSLDDTQRGALWAQLGQMWTGNLNASLRACMSFPNLQIGQKHYIFGHEAPWYWLNGQESMSDAAVAEAVMQQALNPVYWVGR
ncbi:hypothetical protein GGS21DRAFT_500299 [Xylaria nigripes]|nr:hypothetical protein GGS21DRAFT_500299 [Xylaria nigripes]